MPRTAMARTETRRGSPRRLRTKELNLTSVFEPPVFGSRSFRDGELEYYNNSAPHNSFAERAVVISAPRNSCPEAGLVLPCRERMGGRPMRPVTAAIAFLLLFSLVGEARGAGV